MDPPSSDSKTTTTVNQGSGQARTYSPFSCDSPFRLLPSSVTTPPSRFVKVKNPFEAYLADKLHLSIFSPSVFTGTASSSNGPMPKTEDGIFKWAIEEISNLKPADIDENHVYLQESPCRDSYTEKAAQASIERYFSEKLIVPSPFEATIKTKPLLRECSSTPGKLNYCTETFDAAAQTVLSLPPKLPEHIEQALRPYFSYTADQQQRQEEQRPGDLKNSSLMRGLFEYDANEQLSPAFSSPAPSCNLSPIELSPTVATYERCNSDVRLMSDCELSPIGMDYDELLRRPIQTRFSGEERMSVDVSIPRVPDTLDDVSLNHHSNYYNVESPPPEHSLSNSSVNWDIEYKQLQIVSSSKTSLEQRMDVSLSNTPKSRKLIGQRKKLSDSFMLNEEKEKEEKEDDDDDNNDHLNQRKRNDIFRLHSLASTSTVDNQTGAVPFGRCDSTDTGYNTGNTLSEEWSPSYVFASTPTKSIHPYD